ncbi:MAG TPA: hypothetical protein VFE17_09935 [Candidatus Baltobacteraceae bacterium]|nr:hypothetical protein [Candidatus Baltobacteraceae bacterium]
MRTLLNELVDYAGLFPPARLAMADAVPEYIGARTGAYAWMLGRFIVPFSRAGELVERSPQGSSLELSVILDGGVADLAQVPHSIGPHRVKAVEVVLQPEEVEQFARTRARSAVAEIPAYIEFQRNGSWSDRVVAMMHSVKAVQAGAKVRCGGVNAGAFPSCEELALFIEAACREDVPFKATAGLHHPFPHTDPASGVRMHGFMNLLTCTALARAAAPRAQLIAALKCADVSAFGFDDQSVTFQGETMDVQAIAAMRQRSFVSYGSCSFEEPVDDLRALGIL